MKLINIIKKPTILLMIFTVIGNILSFLKNVIIAKFFGTSATLDAYIVAVFIPTLLSGLFMGSLQAALVPMVIENIRKHGQEYAFRLYKTISLLVVLFMLVLSFVFIFISEMILEILPLGFKHSNHELVVSLSNILIFMIVFNAINILLKNLYHINNQFLIPALSTVIGSIFSIVFIIIGDNPSIYKIAYSLYVGIIIDILVLMLLLSKISFKLPKGFDFKDKNIKQTLLLIAPLTISASLGHANPFIDQIMASNLFEGAVSALNYADKLNSMLIQIFVLTLSTVVLSRFSFLVANNQFDELKNHFNRILKIYSMILFPLIILIFLLGHEIVYVLFKRGAFTEKSTALTAQAWGIYSSGIIFVLIGIVCSRVLNALKNVKFQMFVSLIGLILNVIGNLCFMKVFGYLGIALSTTITTFTTTILLVIYLNVKLGNIIYKRTFISLNKILMTNFLVTILSFVIKHTVDFNYGSKISAIFYICGISFIVIFITLFLYWLFGLIKISSFGSVGAKVNGEK